MAENIGCRRGSLPFCYLGIPIGERMANLKGWDPVIQKFKSKLANWKANLLSIGGRATLLSSVLGALPNYYISLFRIPKKVSDLLERLRASFFWGGNETKKNMSWVKWDLTLSDKTKGGLGFGSINGLNLALLLKWKWRFLTCPKSVWVKIIDSIHGSIDVFDKNSVAKGNGIWSRIVKSIHYLQEGNLIPSWEFKKIMGQGDSTRFWKDVWIGNDCLASLLPRLFMLETNKDCYIKDRFENGVWKWEWRRDLRGGVEIEQFRTLINLVQHQHQNEDRDKWKWDFEGQNDFAVKQVRSSIEKKLLPTVAWQTKWNNSLPKKINIFVWRLFLDKLPTRENLLNKGIDVPFIMCPFCSREVESAHHLFNTCWIAKKAWNSVIKWLQLSGPIPLDNKEIYSWLQQCQLTKNKKKVVESIVFTTWWAIWKARNEAIFKANDLKTELIFDNIVHYSFLWIVTRNNKLSLSWTEWLKNPLMHM